MAGLFPALALAAMAAWEIVAASGVDAGTGSDSDWIAAADAVRAAASPDDLIVFAPGWIDPIGRRHLGDRISLAMAGRMDAARYAVIWEISARGARAPDTRGLTADQTRAFGSLTLRRYRQPAVGVVTDFLAEAEARRMTTAGRMSRAVRVGLEEVGFEPHRCISVEPAPDQTVRVTFSAVTLGSTLVGYVGLADVFTRRDVREPARLAVEVAGEPATEVTVGVDDGWVRFDAATTPGRADVEFALTALGPRARQRQVCFAAEARQ